MDLNVPCQQYRVKPAAEGTGIYRVFDDWYGGWIVGPVDDFGTIVDVHLNSPIYHFSQEH